VRPHTSTVVPAQPGGLLQHILLVPRRLHHALAMRRARRCQYAAGRRHPSGESATPAAAEDAACGGHGSRQRPDDADAGGRGRRNVDRRVPDDRPAPTQLR